MSQSKNPGTYCKSVRDLIIPPKRLSTGEDTYGKTISIGEMPPEPREVCVRKWVTAGDGKVASCDLTVMTYNILSDVYMEPGSYEYCPVDIRYSASRTGHIVAEVYFYRPDFVCFQEVSERHHMVSLSTAMAKLGFKGFHMPYKHRLHDGLSIFYNARLFSLLEARECQIGDLINEYARIMDLDDPVRNAVRTLAELSCGLLCGKFRQTSTNKVVTIGNIHVAWCDFMLPILQTLEVAVAINSLKETAGESPFILCGDFNSPPSFAPYHLLSRGRLLPEDPAWNTFPDFRVFKIKMEGDEREACSHETVEIHTGEQLAKNCALYGKRANAIREEIAHQAELKEFVCKINKNVCLGVKSAYDNVSGCEPEVTNCDTSTWSGHVSELSVDYLWYNEDLTATKVLETPTRESIRRHLALPSLLHPSDHIPLMAGFRFTE